MRRGGDEVNWIKCSEELPPEDEVVIVAIYGTDFIVLEEGETLVDALKRNSKVKRVDLGYLAEDGWNGIEGFPLNPHPKYWLRLPEIPEGVEE